MMLDRFTRTIFMVEKRFLSGGYKRSTRGMRPSCFMTKSLNRIHALTREDE